MSQIRKKILNQQQEIAKTLYGLDEVIKIYILSKACDLTVMLLGAHATAKSSLARMWSITTGLNYRVVTSCFDKETEVLTENGWVLIEEVPSSWKLATLNLISGNLEYQFPLKKIVEPYKGKMLHFKNKSLDILVTPNHRIIYKTRGGVLELREAASLLHKRLRLKDTVLWVGPNPEYLDLPFGKVETKSFLRFLGYWLAEGHISYSPKWRSYEIYFRNNNSAYLQEYEEIVKELGFNPIRNAKNSIKISNKNLYLYLKQFGHSQDKFIPKEILSLGKESLEVLFDSWIKGDGEFRKGKWYRGTSVSKKLIDDLQEISLKLGLSSYVWTGKTMKGLPQYQLGLKYEKRDPILEAKNRDDLVEDFEGLVFCFTTPNHTLIARRNGKVFCSGNSEVDESLISYIDPAIFREKNVVQMRRGELMEKEHIIIDEFFLWLNKYRAKLHQLLEEHTYAGLDVLTKTYTFLSNPLSEHYAGQIEEKNLATVDRIDLFIPVNQPKIVPCESMMRKFSKFGRQEKPLEKVISWEDYLAAKEEIVQVIVPSRVVIWLTLFAHSMASCKHVSDKWSVSVAKMKKLCINCNENGHLCARVLLSKPRFLRATIILAKGLAWLGGRNIVTFEDINEAIQYTLPHRITWIQEDLSYAESLESVSELMQQFNDEMLAWKNRGIFSELAKVIEGSKKTPPVYEEKIGRDLFADVSEIHLLKDFVAETLQSAKEDIARYYLAEGVISGYETLTDLKQFLEQSGLEAFEKEELVYEIILRSKKLYYSVPSTPENIEKLVDTLIALHKKEQILIDDKMLLTRKFGESVAFDSELVKIREHLGEIQILFEDKLHRSTFIKLWDES